MALLCPLGKGHPPMCVQQEEHTAGLMVSRFLEHPSTRGQTPKLAGQQGRRIHLVTLILRIEAVQQGLQQHKQKHLGWDLSILSTPKIVKSILQI